MSQLILVGRGWANNPPPCELTNPSIKLLKGPNPGLIEDTGEFKLSAVPVVEMPGTPLAAFSWVEVGRSANSKPMAAAKGRALEPGVPAESASSRLKTDTHIGSNRMSDYNLYGLDPRTFQHMVQALAVQELGAGVIVYGDGRDGARDATYKGKVNYPSSVDQWDGYLIIQVKYRQKQIDDTSKAGDWVVDQLESDLKKFGAASTKRTAPDYYILVTNVDLTPVPEVGTEALVRKTLSAYSEKLGIKGFDIWDGTKVRTLLNSHRDIAIAFWGYITSGDVLAKMYEFLDGLSPSFEDVMSDYLQGELVGPEQFARLSEAGSTTERKTVLADVFIDLPISRNRISDPPVNERENGLSFVNLVLQSGSIPQDRESIEHRQSPRKSEDESDAHADISHFVLIGGPGQGKSTLGQYICQLYRASILDGRPLTKLSPEAAEAIRYIKRRCAEDSSELPSARRFPVRVELKAFADELAKEKCGSLLEYISQRIDKRSAQKVDRGDLHRWLSKYPWLLVLDGLDEVPASGNRTEVMDAIKQFSSQCATRSTDIIIIGTSRPQGYGEEFSSKIYSHFFLVPLSTMRALHYAKRLAEACHPTDPDLRGSIIERLERSASRPTTERLMRSPLQVTILAILAELRGELPDDRWQLFEEYYQTICNRETQRNQALSSVIREYAFEITKLHQHVGLKLQVANETKGENDAFLSKSQLFDAVFQCLSDRFDDRDSQRANVSTQIADAALERLVFLVSPLGEQIGFEIRSLQEFMAARALMSGSDEEICKRLEAIAPYPFWRNVFLFASGKCARDRQYLVDKIVGICQTLNHDNDNIASLLTLAGSRLAIDLLEDDTFRHHRKTTLALADIALGILKLPPDEDTERLVSICRPKSDLVALYTRAITQNLAVGNVDFCRNAWSLLISLIEAGHRWAEVIAERYWPSTHDEQAKIIGFPYIVPKNEWLADRIVSLMPHLDPYMVRASRIAHDERRLPNWIKSLSIMFESESQTSNIRINSGVRTKFPLGIDYVKLPESRPEWADLVDMPQPNPAWARLVAGVRFSLEPSKESLSRELRWLSEIGPPTFRNWSDLSFIPWPLFSCLRATDHGESLSKLSVRASQGEFGDIDRWRANEKRWSTEGVDTQSLLDAAFEEEFSLEHAWKFFPLDPVYKRKRSAHLGPHVRFLCDLFERASGSQNRYYISIFIIDCILQMASEYRQEGYREKLPFLPSTATFLTWIEESSIPDFYIFSTLKALPLPRSVSEEWIKTLEDLGQKHPELYHGSFGHPRRVFSHNEPSFKSIAGSFMSDPCRHGLLPWITAFVLRGLDFDFRFPDDYIHQVHSDGHKACFIILRLAQGNLSNSEVGCYSSWINQQSIDFLMTGIFHYIYSSLYKHQNKEWAIQFVSSLLKPSNLLLAGSSPRCIEWLNECLSSRKSPLHNSRVISELGLSGVLTA